jgi:transposase-like protein
VTLRRRLVQLSVVEQRYRAVLEVQSGSSVSEVAARFGVSRQAVHRWLRWYREHGLAGFERSPTSSSAPACTCHGRRLLYRSG